jgi:hypothetical protein
MTMSFQFRTIWERNLSLKTFLLKKYFTSNFFGGKKSKNGLFPMTNYTAMRSLKLRIIKVM